MRKILNNKLLMYWTVLEVLAKYKQVWNTITGFTAVHEQFEATVKAIQKISAASDVKTNEVTEGKNHAIAGFIVELFKCISILSVNATRTNNKELKSRVDYTESELENMRPSELLSLSQEVLELATANIAELTKLGLTDADTSALVQFIENFEEITSATRTTITARKTAGGQLKSQFTEARFILNEQLDGLMEQFRTKQPVFYNEYWNARKTVDYGIRHEKKEGTEDQKFQ